MKELLSQRISKIIAEGKGELRNIDRETFKKVYKEIIQPFKMTKLNETFELLSNMDEEKFKLVFQAGLIKCSNSQIPNYEDDVSLKLEQIQMQDGEGDLQNFRLNDQNKKKEEPQEEMILENEKKAEASGEQEKSSSKKESRID